MSASLPTSKLPVWVSMPKARAPFKVAIVVVNTEDDAQMDAALYLYENLRKQGISTILDDREERVGVKFNDMDLIGIPIRITVGNKINDQIVEIKQRKKDEFEEISLYDVYKAGDVVSAGELFSIHENTNVECPVGAKIQGVLEIFLSKAH